MADFGAIRQALADALAGVPTIKAAYPSVPDSIVEPSVIVVPSEPFADYHEAHGGYAGLAMFRFELGVCAARMDARSGQATLDALIGTGDGTIAEALERLDPTLGGTVQTCRLVAAGDYGSVVAAGIDYLGCRITVEVHV